MKPENKRKKSRVKSFVLIAFLVIYVPSLFHWVYGKSINTEILRIGTIEDSINVDGCIVRDEIVLISPFEGKYIPEVAEGEKVPVNFRVATILKESSIKLLDEKNELDLKIIKQQDVKNDNEFIFSADIVKIEKEIKRKVDEVVDVGNMNTLSGADQLRRDIDKLIKKKASILGGIDTKDAYVNSLKKEKEKIEKQIKSSTKDVYTKTSGIISYIIDGYEQILNPKAIKELTPDFLSSIKEIKVTAEDNDTGIEKPFAKIIKGNYCYIVVICEASQAEKFESDRNIKLRLNDIGKEIYGKITYISDSMKGKYVVAVRIDRCISETTAFRKVNMDMVRNSHEGLKVPVKSLKYVDLKEMKGKIVMVEANHAEFKEVEIKGINNEYAIIQSEDGSVSLYDTYVLNPGNIKEGQIINQ